MSVDIKICGLNTPETVEAAVAGHAAYIGFVFFETSPRAITPDLLANLCWIFQKMLKK